METALVTGGAGFVGSSLVKRLLIEGYLVKLFDLPGTKNLEILQDEIGDHPNLRILTGDITHFSDVSKAVEGVDIVFHTAALLNSIAPYRTFYSVNVLGTENLCKACLNQPIKRLVLVSTSDVFGIPAPGETLSEASAYKPWNEPYADTKIKACETVKRYNRLHNLPTTIIYPGWVYGPGDRQFFPTVIEMVKEKHVFVWSRGKPYEVDLIYIDDLIDGIVSAALNPAAVGQDYLILDNDTGFTPERFFRFLAQQLQVQINIYRVPYSLLFVIAGVSQWLHRKGLTQSHLLSTTDVKAFGNNFSFSINKAKEQLNWEPRTKLEEGLKTAFQWQQKTLSI